MAADAHYLLLAWHEMYTRIAKLRDIFLTSRSDTSIAEELPPESFDALVDARFYLETISLEHIGEIKSAFSASPALRKYHYRGNPGEMNPGVFEIEHYDHLDRDDEVLHRVLTLVRIFENKGHRDLIGLHVVLDEFERLMQDEPRVKELISSHIASIISQLSIMSECLDQLHHLQPWAQKIESAIAENKFQYRAEYDKSIHHWGEINRVQKEFRTRRLLDVGNPGDGKFNYPADEVRTRETTEAMISAEAALRTFWTEANAHWRFHVGTTPAALVSHIIGDRLPHRTPPWVEPKTQNTGFRLPHDVFSNSVPFLEHSHNISKQITSNFKKLAVVEKVKKKTRGGAAVEVNSVAIANADEAETTLRTISVDKRAYKVFSSLFHSPDSKDQAGQVAWIDFLHAMTKASFGVEKLQGSAWHFTPQNKDIDRSIQIHEPHPSNKMPFKWARRCGRRLTRAFDWSRETFTLA